MEGNKANLKIFGSGNSSGGKYNTVSIMGEGQINGDVDCIKFKIKGEGTVEGNLKVANKISIMGEGRLLEMLNAPISKYMEKVNWKAT